MKMNAPFRPRTGRMNVDWALNVVAVCSLVPKHGFPSSSHGPKMFSATDTRALFVAQPEQSDVRRKYFPPDLKMAGAS